MNAKRETKKALPAKAADAKKTVAIKAAGLSKNATATARELVTIVAEIHETFRNDTASVVKRGELIIEAKQQVKHGEWLQWLCTHFAGTRGPRKGK